ncbi:hypothetical protein FRB93_011733 [Tulasnella sp. JGI-2019a]|nr:hypothetical protein FRB93_011733 [Tulasnella sp. JGI-2019a]
MIDPRWVRTSSVRATYQIYVAPSFALERTRRSFEGRVDGGIVWDMSWGLVVRLLQLYLRFRSSLLSAPPGGILQETIPGTLVGVNSHINQRFVPCAWECSRRYIYVWGCSSTQDRVVYRRLYVPVHGQRFDSLCRGRGAQRKI